MQEVLNSYIILIGNQRQTVIINKFIFTYDYLVKLLIRKKTADEAYNNRQKMQKAIEQTSANTAETNLQLQKVVENQNAYINVLKEQLSIQAQQLKFSEQQLSILKNIFASGEDGVAVEKEIMKLIQGQIDTSHPLWGYVKDKGGDVAVAGITAGVPVLYNAIKMYLASKGIQLP